MTDAQQRLANYRRNQAEMASRCAAFRDSLAAVRARRHALGQVLSDRSYTTETVQKLFASNGHGEARNFRAVGLLADYAEVEPQYETAVEQFLRDELEYVVVETFDHARAGIALLREEFGGRATFFVDSLRTLELRHQDVAVPFSQELGVSRLDRLVEFRDPLGPAAKQFLPRLRSAFLVEAPEAAERLARDNPSFIFLTADGISYQGRAVTGRRAQQEAGPLAMKRELRALEAEASQLEGNLSMTLQSDLLEHVWNASGRKPRRNFFERLDGGASRGRKESRRCDSRTGPGARRIGKAQHGIGRLPDRGRAPPARGALRQAEGRPCDSEREMTL